MVNVPTGVWIDEAGMIVRPNEVAFSTDTFRQITGIESGRYIDALRDWAKNGANSRFTFPLMVPGISITKRGKPHCTKASCSVK